MPARPRRPVSRVVLAALVVALALVGAAGAVGVLALESVVDSTDTRRAEGRVLERAREIELLVARRAADARAYMLTADERYLAGSAADRAAILGALEVLDQRLGRGQGLALLAALRRAEADHHHEVDRILRAQQVWPADKDMLEAFARSIGPRGGRSVSTSPPWSLTSPRAAMARPRRRRRRARWASPGGHRRPGPSRSCWARWRRAGWDAPSSAPSSARASSATAPPASRDEARLFRLLEGVPVGIAVLRANGTLYYANRHALEIVGRTVDGVAPGATLADLPELCQAYVAGTADLYPAERMPIIRALGGEACTVSDMELRRGGERLPLLVTGVPVRGDDGRVEHAIASFLDIRDVRAAALTDALTGLANRASFAESFGRIRPVCERAGSPLAVALVDLDRFKSINDTHGHAMGDEVLRRVATVVARALRSSDVVARWGGEELVVLLPDTDREGAVTALEKVLAAVRREVFVTATGATFSVSFSAGVAEVPRGASLEHAVTVADERLYAAKRAGRARVLGASALARPPAAQA
ncbi:MAG: sensor domain-containing diguanylate cyclase [Kofleriaceae bacterium]|nr:sensor domain-containing diguanylate cyclase [Kofleriaceae bacterium]